MASNTSKLTGQIANEDTLWVELRGLGRAAKSCREVKR